MVPCTRGLKRFEASGCPQMEYSFKTPQGCPLWIELSVPDDKNPAKKSIKKKCVDLWYFTLLYNALALLEGNQQATESFRNGMLEVNPDNPKQTRPKSTHVILQVMREAIDNKKNNLLPFKKED